MRRSNTLLVCLLVLLAGFITTIIESGFQRRQASEALVQTGDLVRELGLTDIALFTETRYTRHPTQTDLHSAFQDHPGAIEHFPSGSLLPPPSGLLQ
ncbi:MAG: hypothetical protein ABW157_17030 [Candidatus Thiodiazotropha sp. LLP2]